MSDFVTVKGRILSESMLALHFEQKRAAGGYHGCWIPISQCKVITRYPKAVDGSRDASLDLPSWLAEAKDLEVEG